MDHSRNVHQSRKDCDLCTQEEFHKGKRNLFANLNNLWEALARKYDLDRHDRKYNGEMKDIKN